MRTERFRGALLSTLLVTSLMVPLLTVALVYSAEDELFQGYNRENGKWVTGNLGKEYYERDFVSYQLKITKSSEVWGAPEFNIKFNFYQPSSDAVYIDGFDTSENFGFQWSDNLMLPDNKFLPDPGWGTHIPTPEAGESYTAGPKIENFMNAYPPGNSDGTPPGSSPSEFRYFTVENIPWGNVAGDYIVLFFRAHLSFDLTWSAGMEEALPQQLDGDEFEGWEYPHRGSSFATGSSRHFYLEYPGIGQKTVPIPIAEYPTSASAGATLSPTSARENTSIEFTVTVTNDYAADNIDNIILIASGFTQLTYLKPTTWNLSEMLYNYDGVRFDAIGDNVITPGGSETFVFLWTTPNIAGEYMISVLFSKEEVTYTTYEIICGFIVTIGELDWEFVDVTAIDLEPPEKDVGSTTATITTPDIVTVAMENAYPDYTAEVSVWAYNSGTIALIIEKVVIDGTEITGEPPYPVVQLDLNEDGEDDIEIGWRDGFGEQLEPGDDSPEMSFWVRVLQGIPQEETLNSTIEIVAVPWNVASLGLVPLYWSDSIEIDLTVVVISPIQESPWPMFQHDPQHTGKSPYVGPQTNNLLWSRDLGGKWLGPSIIGSDNSIYVPAQGLVALTPNGSIKWQTGIGTAGSRTVTPAIAADGTIYVGYAYSWKLGGYGTGFLYAVNPDTGYRTWALDVNLTTSLLIAPEGTIYTGIGEGAGRIYAFDLNGTVKWTFAATPRGGWPRTPAIGLDDSIIASILFSGANSPNPTVYALDPADGTERWRLELPERANVSSPTIGSDGTIYVRTPRRLYAISQNGSLKWELELGSQSQVTPPAVGPDGTIYVAYFSGDGALYAITPDGSIKWSYPVGVVSSPVIDAEGTIYCAAIIGDASPSEKSLIFALNPDGTLKWDYVVDGYTGWCRTALSLSESRLYVGVDDGTLYAFGPGVLDTTPPTISEVEASDITQSSATITWQTDEPSDSVVEYGTTTDYGLTVSDDELVTSHSIILTGLSAGTFYHYRVKSTDAAGNMAASPDDTFTTLENITPPTCVIQLREQGTQIDKIDVGEFFDIYVGDSADDTGIKRVRFSSDESQDGVPQGEWTQWYDWNVSSGDWNAETKIKKWSFGTGGNKEVWAEIEDIGGNVDNCHANIFALIPEIVFRPPYRLSTTSGWDESYLLGKASYYSEVDPSVGYGKIMARSTATYGGYGEALAVFTLGDYWRNEWSGTATVAATFNITGLITWARFSFPKYFTQAYLGVNLKASLWVYDHSSSMEIWRKDLIIYNEGPEWKLISLPESDAVRYSDTQYVIQGFVDLERDHAYSWHFEAKIWSRVDVSGFATAVAGGNFVKYGDIELIDVRIIAPAVLRPEPEPIVTGENVMYVAVGSPADVLVVDPDGRRIGFDFTIQQEVNEIPEAWYSGRGTYPQLIIIPTPIAGNYDVLMFGTDTDTYTMFTFMHFTTQEVVSFVATNIPTSANAIHHYTIDWDALSENEEGVTLQIDSDGNGTFEQTFTADSELTHDEFMLQTATTIDFDPDTLNLKNKGKVVTVYIELPEGYSVENIDVSTVRLIVDNDNVPAEPRPTGIGDHDNDGIPDLMVKFSKSAVQAIVGMGEVELTVTGLVNGMPFEGNDTIRVIKPGNADLEIRFMEIVLWWALSPPEERVCIEIMFSNLPLRWALAPS